MIVYIVAFVVFALLAVFHFATRKYLNPYKLIFIFGKKGSGKSTLLTKYAMQYMSKGWRVYSTEHIPGTFHISYDDIGFAEFPRDSCIIIDEVGMIWDNRNFKNFKNEVRDWFKLQRHRGITVILASQTFDIDKKLRDLTDEMYCVSKMFRVFSYAKRILRKPTLVEAQGEGESRLTENLQWDSILFFWCGSRKLTYIPRWAPLFDSFDAPPLDERTFVITPPPSALACKHLPKNIRKNFS